MTTTPDGGGEPAAMLSTHSLAVLGLLAVAPMTAYGLAEQMQRTLNPVWGVSRRLLLAEPRRLAQHGLAEKMAPTPGSRARHQWKITPRGQRALQAWLRSPVVPTQVHSELALRVIFADQADRSVLIATVTNRRAQLREEMVIYLARLDNYIATDGPFPHRFHIATATSHYIRDMTLAEYRFCDWMLDELTHWPDTTTPEPTRHRTQLQTMRTELVALLEAL